MNRVITARDTIAERLQSLDAVKVAELDNSMAIEFDEHFAYQNAQARAHVSGLLTSDEAQVIYVALGELHNNSNGGWANGTDTATKCVVTKIVAELLSKQIKAHAQSTAQAGL
jgi:hypothetical protein